MTIGPDHLPITWQMRLGTVFVSGIIFLVITLMGIRGWLARAVSPAMKHSFAAGIGLFLAFIGLNTTKIITIGIPAAPVKIGDIHDPKVLLAIACFVLMAALLCRGFRIAIILCIALTAVAGYMLGLAEAPKGIVEMPTGPDYDLRAIAFQLDVRSVLQLSFLPILITLVLMSFLDTLGTLVAVGSAANLLDKDGNFPQIERPMLVDAVSCIFASLVGTSTSGAYIESAAGIRDGARTGLAAVVTALLFAARAVFLAADSTATEPDVRLRPRPDCGGRAHAWLPGQNPVRRFDRSGARIRDHRDDDLHLQHRQRPDGRLDRVSRPKANDRPMARSQHRFDRTRFGVFGLLRVWAAALKSYNNDIRLSALSQQDNICSPDFQFVPPKGINSRAQGRAACLKSKKATR